MKNLKSKVLIFIGIVAIFVISTQPIKAEEKDDLQVKKVIEDVIDMDLGLEEEDFREYTLLDISDSSFTKVSKNEKAIMLTKESKGYVQNIIIVPYKVQDDELMNVFSGITDKQNERSISLSTTDFVLVCMPKYDKLTSSYAFTFFRPTDYTCYWYSNKSGVSVTSLDSEFSIVGDRYNYPACMNCNSSNLDSALSLAHYEYSIKVYENNPAQYQLCYPDTPAMNSRYVMFCNGVIDPELYLPRGGSLYFTMKYNINGNSKTEQRSYQISDIAS